MEHEKTISFEANKKWRSIPKEDREMLEQNVWCISCTGVVTIQNYTVRKDTQGNIILDGKCNKCSNRIVRVID